MAAGHGKTGACVRFHGANGETADFTVHELAFFAESFSLRKIFHAFAIAMRLVKIGAFSQLMHIPKGFFCAQILKRPMAMEESLAFFVGTVGFAPKYAEDAASGAMFEFTPELPAMIYEIFTRNQYCATERNIRGKIVADAGANTGVFAVYTALLGAKKVYAFEPVLETFSILKRNVARNRLSRRITPVNCALGESKGVARMQYSYAGDTSASITGKAGVGRKSRMVKVTPIDSVLKPGEGLGFLKIDAEGYEERILLGAAKAIRRSKPVLSFSAYHKPGDKERLPAVVKSIRADYACRLNRIAEEDFYCE